MLNKDLIAGADAAAQHCGLTARKIYHMVEAGLIPFMRKGGRLYFRKSELDAAFSSQVGTVN